MHRLRSSARQKRLDLTGKAGDLKKMDLLDTSISLERALKLAALEGGLGGGEGGGVLGAQIRGPAHAGGGAEDEMNLADVGMLTGEELTGEELTGEEHDMKRLKTALKNLHAQLRAAQREKELQDLQERALADMMKTTLEQVEQSHNDVVSNMQRQVKEAGDLQRSHENEKQLLVMELEQVRGKLKEVLR